MEGADGHPIDELASLVLVEPVRIGEQSDLFCPTLGAQKPLDGVHVVTVELAVESRRLRDLVEPIHGARESQSTQATGSPLREIMSQGPVSP